MKKIFSVFVLMVLIAGCTSEVDNPKSPSPEASESYKEVTTLPVETSEPTFLPDNVVDMNSDDYAVVTFYDRAKDIIGKKIEAVDSDGTVLTTSNGFSVDNSKIIIDDTKPLQFIFDANKGGTKLNGEPKGEEYLEKGDYIELSCMVYLEGKKEVKCSDTLKVPNYLGTNHSVYLIELQNGGYALSLSE